MVKTDDSGPYDAQIEMAVLAGDWKTAADLLEKCGRDADAKRVRNSLAYCQQDAGEAWAKLKAAVVEALPAWLTKMLGR